MTGTVDLLDRKNEKTTIDNTFQAQTVWPNLLVLLFLMIPDELR